MIEDDMQDQRRRPNVVFILGDDWGWGDLGCFGHQRARTPHLDTLAGQGCRYTQFYVAAPVCSPSRASFLTGRFPAMHGFHHICDSPENNRRRAVPDYLTPTVAMLPRLLQRAGYATAHFGKWHLGASANAPDPGAYGFDVHRGVQSTGPDLRDLPEFAGMYDEGTPRPHATSDVRFRPHSTRAIVEEGIRFIEENRDRPFYLQLWLLDPHATLNPTDEQLAPYRGLSPPGLTYPGAMTIYYAALTEADRQLGRLLHRLDELQLVNDTIVIFTGDNGPEDLSVPNASHSAAGSVGPFRGRKRSLYEGGIRMPLIVRWPGHTPANTVDDTSVLGSVDLLPSLCAITGTALPRETVLDGADRSGSLREPVAGRQRPLLWEFRFAVLGHPINRSPMLAIRDHNWKLLLNPDRSRVELYDIPHDRMELHNVAADHPATVRALSDRALAWQRTLPAGPVSERAGANDYPWPTGLFDAAPA